MRCLGFHKWNIYYITGLLGPGILNKKQKIFYLRDTLNRLDSQHIPSSQTKKNSVAYTCSVQPLGQLVLQGGVEKGVGDAADDRGKEGQDQRRGHEVPAMRGRCSTTKLGE